MIAYYIGLYTRRRSDQFLAKIALFCVKLGSHDFDLRTTVQVFRYLQVLEIACVGSSHTGASYIGFHPTFCPLSSIIFYTYSFFRKM